MEDDLIISAMWLLYILYALLCIFLFCPFANFPFYHVRYKMLQEVAAEDGSDQDRRIRWMGSNV